MLELVNDDFSIAEDTTIVDGDVLANDTVEDSATVSLESGVSNGSLTLNDDGTFTYTPDLDFNGTDTFIYKVTDVEESATATATISVAAVNDAPSFTAGPDQSVLEDAGAQTINPWATDLSPGPTNESGQSLSFNVTNTNNALFAAQPTVLPDGTLSFTPAANAFGTATVTVEAMDNGGTANNGVDTTVPQTFTIEIVGENDAPIAADDTGRTHEDTVFNGNVLDNDSDVDGDNLTIVSVNQDTDVVGSQITLPSGALLTLNPDGSFNYDPNNAFEYLQQVETETDSFTYTVSDGNGGGQSATVTMTIDGVNDAPDARDDALTIEEDTPASGNVLVDNGSGPDSDPEDDTLVIAAVNGEADDVDNEITLPSGALLKLNADGSFVYTPVAGFTGTDTFDYTISDAGDSVDDATGLTDTATVTITVMADAVNEPPVAADDAFGTDEDTLLSGNVLSDNSNGPDSDPDGDSLTVTLGQDVTNGTLTLDPDGTFTYTPKDDYNGTDSFTYTLSDGEGGSDTATVTITVDPVNDPPVAQDDALATDEDTPVSGNVLSDNGSGPDSDIDGDVLTVSLLQDVSDGTLTLGTDGAFTYIPGVDVNGVDMFAYQVSDGDMTDTATVTIAVDPVNDAPVAADDAFSTDEDTPVSGNVLSDNGNGADSDIDGDALTVSLLQDVSDGTVILNADGTFTYTPEIDFFGTDTFTYRVSDGNLADTATVTIVVDPVNDPPVAQDDALATNEDTVISGNLTADNGSGPDSDPDGDMLFFYLINRRLGDVDNPTILPSGALLGLNADGRYFYDPNGAFDHLALGETAIDSFNYRLSDGQGGIDTATVTVTIDGVNDAPDAVDDDFATGKASGVFGNVLADNGNGADSDPDGGTSLIVTHVNGSAAAVGSQILLPSGALLMLNADGSFLYGTNGAFEALGDDESFADSFTYTIGDGDGGSDGATATVTIDGGNEAPVAADDALATDEDTAITGNVFSDNGNGPDSDANGDTLTVSAVNGAAAAVGNEIMLPSGARLTLNSNGSFVYDPMGAFDDLSPGEADTDGFAYTVSDGKGGSATATVSIGIDGLVDVIRGTPQEDDLSGTDGDDLIYALASDDIIDPRGGSHMIDGGSGTDTVVYATTRSVFDVDLMQASGFTVGGESAALVGGHIVVERPDGETDTLIDVERIDFTDGDLIYDIDSPNVEVVYRMYAAALGRTPDETGLRYWVDRLDFLDDLPGSTADSLLQVLADVFIEADEFEMLYGSDPSNADYIDAMYQNVLGRLPDDEGRAFWIDAMERGLERDDILIAFSESAENRDQTGPDLDDGIWVV